jgi:PEP-CTERM motif
MFTLRRVLAASLAATIACATASISYEAQAATCIGNCGHKSGTLDGVVVPAPGSFGEYDWVSTANGIDGAAGIAGYDASATNGSELLSDIFFAAIGQVVSFNFNYVTSDGSSFADYGFAQLINTSTNEVYQLFNARTVPDGAIIPGRDLPPVVAELSPATVSIIPGAPTWSPLGASSGTCYNSGCGYTGWVASTFAVPTEGSYQLRFGAANWSDTGWDSGLAFSGLLLDGAVIGDGSSADDPLLPQEIGPNGEFQFEFTATPNQVVFIDPVIATGYDFEVQSGQLILSALFPELGDADGYDLFNLTDLVNPIATGVMGGSTFSFGTGVSGFALRGIDPALSLDPTDVGAFVTGLTFDVSGPASIAMTQTPVTEFSAAVPEASTWAMMILGLGMLGGALRRRSGSTAVAVA